MNFFKEQANGQIDCQFIQQASNIMKLHQTANENEQVYLTSDYKGYDVVSFKKEQQCNLKIPTSILIDHGMVKDWLFNPIKGHNFTILKKKHQNLVPLTVVKHFCTVLGYGAIAAECKTIIDLKMSVIDAMKQQKNYEYTKDKKVIDVFTSDNQTISMSLRDFLVFVSENKFTEQMFYDQWRIIQERVVTNKIQQEYHVESLRDSHGTLVHKCQKLITVLNGYTGTVSTQLLSESAEKNMRATMKDPFAGSSPSKSHYKVAETKNMEGYKFFDTYLNKKFFQMSQQVVQFVEKNLKCTVGFIDVRYVINKERQPFFMGINEMKIRPNKKIANMRQYLICKEKGCVKFEDYLKPLTTYYTQKLEQNRNANTKSAIKKNRCHGEFCDCKPTLIPHFYTMELTSKLPSLMAQKRRTPPQIIEAVSKRKGRVIERLRQYNYIHQSYKIEVDSSSEYESDQYDDSNQKGLKTCQNCYLFYINVLKLFQLDTFKNLVEKKNSTILKSLTSRTPSRSAVIKDIPIDVKDKSYNDSPIKSMEMNEIIQNAKNQVGLNQSPNQIHLAKTKPNRFRAESLNHQSKSQVKRVPQIKSNSATKLSYQQGNKYQSRSKVKLDSISRKIQKKYLGNNNIFQEKEQKKGSNISAMSKISQPIRMTQRPKPKKIIVTKVPESFLQASSQLLEKLTKMPSSSEAEFIYFAKKYCKDNYPQFLDRRCYSSENIKNLYTFYNNSPIHLEHCFDIKKRPEMSLKRLSELTDYPEIVSRSTFHFDTLIIDQVTTVPFCVISTKMLGNKDFKSKPFQNILIFNDLFDSFIQHISVAKTMIEQSNNKRVLLFNRPGQSHTIYNKKQLLTIAQIGIIVDKLLYRLSNQKQQLKMIDFEKDSFKFVGFGYGGYLLSSYLGYYHFLFPKITGVLLINGFATVSAKYRQTIEDLLRLYDSQDPTIELESFLYYNKAIGSSQQTRDEIDRKSGLNSIRVSGRIYTLKSLLAEADSAVSDGFQQISYCPVNILYGVGNLLVKKFEVQRFLMYQKNQQKKQIPLRRLFECDGGYDLNADNFDEIEYRMTEFVRLGENN